MMQLSQAALAHALPDGSASLGQVIGQDVLFTSVGTDSRNVMPGELFVALHGDHFDGHAYARQALENGAAAAMISQQQGNITPALLVKDTRLALGSLAAYWRSQMTIPLVAITGSNGKTTVKEMLAGILSIAAESSEAVLATQGNFNNDIGLPLTLLKLRAWHRYAVAEMGMNHAGEIAYLTGIARPDIALINNAGNAHIGELGSLENIAKAKGEIFEGLADGGTAIFNADDVFAPLWQTLAAGRQIMTFGLQATADVSASYQLNAAGGAITLHTPQGNLDLHLPVAGLHNVRNALAAATAALAVGIDKLDIAKGLAAFGGVKGRLQHKAGQHGAVVIDDTYNANPASMKAAIDVLATQPGLKIMVMGDMGELGEDAAAMHAEIGRYAKSAGIQQLYALGELSRGATATFGAEARHFDSAQAIAEAIAEQINENSVVLVKGSRFMRMERVVDLLTTTQASSTQANKGSH